LPRVVGRLGAARRHRIQDEPPDALRIRGGQERALRARVRVAEEHGPLGPNRVDDGEDVVDEILERRQVVGRVAVGDAGSAPVDDHQPREGAETAQERFEKRILPQHLEVADHGHEDEIDGTVADHRVADRDLAVPSEVDLPRRLHANSIPDPETAVSAPPAEGPEHCA
jgi:hypothetical protein